MGQICRSETMRQSIGEKNDRTTCRELVIGGLLFIL